MDKGNGWYLDQYVEPETDPELALSRVSFDANNLQNYADDDLDSLVAQAVKVRDRKALAILLPHRRSRLDSTEQWAVIAKCENWWLEKQMEVWQEFGGTYESFAQYVEAQAQEAYSTVLNYCAVWEFYRRKLDWPPEKMAACGYRKLEICLPAARSTLKNGLIDPLLDSLLIDPSVSSREILVEFRRQRRVALSEALGDEPEETEAKPQTKFVIYSSEHEQVSKRGIIEVWEDIGGSMVIEELGRMRVENKRLAHHIWRIADKAGMEVL